MSQQLKRPDRAADALGLIVDVFGKETFPDVIKKAYVSVPSKPSDKWSIMNRVIMHISGTADARGYRQWQTVGRHVKKGTKAIYILKVFTKKITVEDHEGNETDRMVPVGMHGIPVFRYEDTDGKALEEFEPREMPPLIDVAKKWGVSVQYENSTHGEYGAFAPGHNSITLCTEAHDVFFHELAHKAHSKIESLVGGQDPKQEAVAQLTACVLSRLYGYDEMAWSWQYIAHYAGEKSPQAVGRLCMSVLSKVEKVLDLILSEKESIDSKPQKAKQDA